MDRPSVLLSRRLTTVALAAWLLAGPAPGQPQPSGEAPVLKSPLTPEQQERLKERDGYGRQANQDEDQGKVHEAIAAAEKMLGIERELFGDVHAAPAATLRRLARLHMACDEFDAARKSAQEVLKIQTKLYGEQSWQATDARWALADVDRAEKMGPDARRRLMEAGRQNRKVFVLANQGKFADAMGPAQSALDARRELLGEKHPDYAASLNSLGYLYEKMGDYAKAEPLYRQALDVRKQALGEKHPDYAGSLNNVAYLCESMGEYARAEPLYRQALEVYKQALGEKQPNYVTMLNNLGLLYVTMGDYAKAESLYRQALEVYKEALGEKHPAYAVGLNNLAALYESMEDYTKAEQLCRQALDVSRGNLELASAVESERQQLAMTQRLRAYLDHYVSLAARADQPGKAVYAPVLTWKGAVSARQQRQRLQSKRPELADDLAKLQSASSRLAALALAVPDPKRQEARLRQIKDLNEEKERLESALAGRSAEFRGLQESRQLSPAQLQGVLPKDAVLVDFLEYTQSTPSPKDKGKWIEERRLAAFVVRPDSIKQLDLGPVKPIADAIDRWRGRVQLGRAAKDQPDPGAELRRRIWAPLVGHMQGAKTVLVSPDGALARLPLAALPGSKPDTYLIEDVAVAVVPVPQLLPELLAPREKEDKSEPSLLLVGDVDYGAEAGLADARADSRSAVRGGAGALLSFPALEGTGEEILAVKGSFTAVYPDGRVTMLHKDKATEGAVKEQAPKCRWLHLATHGFFAPEELRSALAPCPERGLGKGEPAGAGGSLGSQGVSGFNPGLLSGLAFAGANHAPAEDRDDGILTALEVAEMDLSGVDLATLSACETGLGKTAGGEGVLGLQQAFQAAGARSVISSLWSVETRRRAS